MDRRRMMGKGGNISAEFKAADNLNNFGWIEIDEEKIFKSKVFEVRRNKKIRCCINASKYEGFIYKNGELAASGKGNISFGFYAKKDFVITAEIEKDVDVASGTSKIWIKFEIEEKEGG